MAESKKSDEAAASTEKKAPAAKATAAKADKPATKAPAKAKAEKATSAKAEKAPAKATSAKAEKTPAKAKAEKATAEKAPAKATSAKAEKAPAKATSTKAEGASAARKRPAASSAGAEGAGGTLKLHHLRPAPGSRTAKTRVGRGEAGARGKTAGRGTKGTKARYQVPERFEGGQMPMHMRLPKLRGFKNPFRTEYQVVNLDTLATLYPKGGDVTVEDLVAKGAVRKGAPVKVLGNGDVGVKLTVTVQKVSASAREKILAAGGTIQD